MKQQIEALLTLVEHPHTKKSYNEYKKILEAIGRPIEAKAFEYLIEKKFHVTNDTNTHQEQ